LLRQRGDCIESISTELENSPFYHHCMPFSQVHFGTITANPDYSYSDFLPAYEWLEQEIGFFPHFLSVGNSETAISRTGYADNWRVFDHGEFTGNGYLKFYHKKGEFPNLVLLSFDDAEGVFMDDLSWNIAINACMHGRTVTRQETKMILKPSWNKRRWIHAAEQDQCWVCLLAPELFLDSASGISVRNQSTKKEMENRGFRNIRTLRIPVEKLPF
jgi:hypothetical protein